MSQSPEQKLLRIGKDADGRRVTLDLQKVINSRALIQANSGGGKSWLLRLICEQAAPHVQTIVFDIEGEFQTLREKLDMVLVGPNGEIPSDPRTAAVLARKLTEIGCSAVIDISELKAKRGNNEKQRMVRSFLEGLMAVPRKLWHPMLVVIDEAHTFAPEQSQSEARDAVVDLITRGRKRGFSALLATQRLSKLSKDAAAELTNKFIGLTNLDNDKKRAADELGFSGAKDRQVLSTLKPGEFFCFGPALSHTGVARMMTGQVKTTHPEPGSRHQMAMPSASKAIQSVVGELEDLSRRDEDEPVTVEDAEKIIKRLKGEKSRLERELEKPREPAVDLLAIKNAVDQRDHYWQGQFENLRKTACDYRAKVLRIAEIAEVGDLPDVRNVPAPPDLPDVPEVANNSTVRSGSRRSALTIPRQQPTRTHDNGTLPKGEAAMLAACIQFADGLERNQLTVLTGYKRSSRDTYIQRLREKGLVTTDGRRVMATDDGRTAMPDAQPLPTGTALQEYWMDRLPSGESAILSVLLDAGGNPVGRDEIDAETGYRRSSRDTYIQRLKAKELVVIEGRGEVAASPTLFD